MNINAYLDAQALRINTPAFIASDPVQFPRRYTRLQDVEIAAFTVATIAWGKRSIILNSAERMLAKMGSSPYDFVMNRGYRSLGEANVHRTFFEHDLAYMLRGFELLYTRHASLDSYLKAALPQGCDGAPWRVAAALQAAMSEANSGATNSRCLPSNLHTTALKRINLALRWLVRNDGIVDMGVWSCLNPAQLYIPLDLHVGNTARALGILHRKSNDRKAVEELTAILRGYCLSDPVRYDFALFGEFLI
jgi:uncharacterized protein (TIGR02757 family)